MLRSQPAATEEGNVAVHLFEVNIDCAINVNPRWRKGTRRDEKKIADRVFTALTKAYVGKGGSSVFFDDVEKVTVRYVGRGRGRREPTRLSGGTSHLKK